jgi:hypothetical protein
MVSKRDTIGLTVSLTKVFLEIPYNISDRLQGIQKYHWFIQEITKTRNQEEIEPPQGANGEGEKRRLYLPNAESGEIRGKEIK